MSDASQRICCSRCGGALDAPGGRGDRGASPSPSSPSPSSPSPSSPSPSSPASSPGDPAALRCRHCGAPWAPEPVGAVPRHELFTALRATALGHYRDLAPEAQSVACQECGAVTVTSHHAVRCPFCAGALVAAEPAGGILPDAVAPFVLDEAAATAAVARWLGRRWLAPSDLARVAERDRLQSVYLPYWSFSVTGRATYAGQRGDASYHTERRVGSYGRITEHRVRKVKWRVRHGQVERELRDSLVPATASLPPELLDALEPWRGDRLVPFSSARLHGHLAERYSVDLSSGFAVAQQRLERKLRAAARLDIGGDEQRVSHLRVKHEDGSFRHVLLPAWSTALRYRGRIYRIAVNAQSGVISGERPYSHAKITATVAALVLLVAAALTAWWFLRPAPPDEPPPDEPEATYVASR